jgi:1-acyl-sn-glycerol-3-phosphate acyltransferase
MSEYAPPDARDRVRFVFHATPLRRFTVALVRVVFKPLMRLEVNGLSHVPGDGPLVLASNHISNFDVFAMQLALPRTIFFMGKAELFRLAPLGALLRDFGAFPVYRGEKDVWALHHARKVLDAGQVLGMFPEGHRSKGRGLGIAKTGSARLALEAHAPILPMALIGTDRLLKSLNSRPRVFVSFLEPVQAEWGETPESLTERLMSALAAALPQDMRGAYAHPRM